MAVSYNRLWKLLIDKKMSKANLRKAAGIAPNTMTKLSRDETVTLATLATLWNISRRKNMINIRKLEAELWESADLLRAGSKLTSNQYCMPVLGLIFLRYAYSRFKLVEAEILKDRPMRGGRVLPVEASDFASRSALFLPREAQYAYLVTLPENIPAAGLTNWRGEVMNSLGEVVNNATETTFAPSAAVTGADLSAALAAFAPTVTVEADKTITREELMVLLWNYVGKPAAEADLSVFTDGASVSAESQPAVAWAVAQGLLKGTDGALDLGSQVTRAQAATLIVRLIALYQPAAGEAA